MGAACLEWRPVLAPLRRALAHYGLVVATSACIFCSVAGGDPAAASVVEVERDDETVSFLDHRPLFPGHVLVIPKAHRPTLAELSAQEACALFAQSRRVALALPGALGAEGAFVALNNVISQSVAHVHLHVVPRRRKDGLRGFFWPRRRYGSQAEALAVAAALRAELARQPGPGTS